MESPASRERNILYMFTRHKHSMAKARGEALYVGTEGRMELSTNEAMCE